MTTEIGGKNIAGSGYNLWDFMAIGVSKKVTEAALQPVLGNGTLKSGLIKGTGGLILDSLRPKAGMMGKVGEYVTAGLIVDAVEDVTFALLGGNPLGSLMGQGNADNSEGIVLV